MGSVIRLEEENIGGTDGASVITIKQSLTGPYAAIGDTFFWGALQPFAAIVASVLAFRGYVIAPLAFLMIYTPAHIWVRLKGFLEGYRRGKQGIEFIRIFDLPRVSAKIRWVSLIILGFSALWLSYAGLINLDAIPGIVFEQPLLSLYLLLFLDKNRISQFYILYGAALIFFLISWKDF